jgi:hypothetical protein
MVRVADTAREELLIRLRIELHRCEHGWQASIIGHSGADVRGSTKDEVLTKAKALALRMMADEADEQVVPVPRTFRVECRPSA